ncbi:conserved Plasmodium protein, unknown function [Plasmodium gallinaceum]|uniref:Uncharacterized protein n=1 Tax=Plasmodium gallinaceum TaxID=5849 RepID=A0A1J1GYV3_PLAGA|nr:conserved Plasmodium protein, unknown function [Plasmodium gallinaceum]CRG96195.1 conserved Plasmodium protein, unknown function [Plasmodium gallinaceum]
MNCYDNISNSDSNSINLKKELHNTLVVIGFIIETILNDNNILESVNINDIYKTLYDIFKSRYMCILSNSNSYKEKDNTDQNKENLLNEEIKLKFTKIFYGQKKKKELITIKNLSCIKYAIAGCIYLHGKISNKNISLRNILNIIDYNISLLNNNIYTKYGISKSYIRDVTSSINHYKPIIKENIYHEKEESLKMERICLYSSRFKLSNNISKYSLLYELMFITRSPFIINKFLFSVFNDVICIPNINDKYNDVVIVISCILFVNHFFYHINQKYKINSQFFCFIKKIYQYQVEKIMNIFLLLNTTNHIQEVKNIISLMKKIIYLYSIKY